MRGRALRTGTTVVTVTFKNIKTAKSTAKKYRCVVKAAIEPEKPVEPEVVKATKITEAKAASAKTVSVTFDGAVDTTSATAIKLERGTTAITVTPKYADDAKSVILTSDTSLAAGTYTVTVGSFEPVSFNVIKQTPTSLKITNTTIANQDNARVYFQVLDQYGEVMENYNDSKLEVRAYNVTKGHAIGQGNTTKKDYFVLDCSTDQLADGSNWTTVLNSIGDKVSIVAYLTDNASISCTTELEIVRVYTEELTFGDIKLGDDKRVTTNRSYEIAYTAKDTEGKDVTFDEQKEGEGVISAATVSVDNYNFISSNISAVDMNTISVDSDGHLRFTAGGIAGTAVITAINTITGKTSSITIVVSNTAKLSSVDIADASVASDAGNIKFKAAVTAYDQFGEVFDPKNVKNVNLSSGYGSYFNSITPTPAGSVQINKFTSDGKYVEYEVIGDLSGLKNQSITFNFISKEMGTTGYIKSSSRVTVDDEIEASALEIVKAPDATVEEDGTVKVQIAVKDQYQNKMSNSGYTFNGVTNTGYTVKVYNTNGVLAKTTAQIFADTASITPVAGEDKVYEIALKAVANIDDLYKSGTFTIKLEDGGKVIASKMFNLVVVDKITKYGVSTDKGSYKAGDTVKVTVDAYSTAGFNPHYNGSAVVDVVVTKGAVTAEKTYTKTLKFENGVATFDLTAGAENTASGYKVEVANKNSGAYGISDKYTVVGSAAGKLVADKTLGKLRITDSQGNNTGAWDRKEYATITVTDEKLNANILSSSTTITGISLNSDNTAEVHITDKNVVDTIMGSNYDLATGFTVTGIDPVHDGHNLILSITIGGFTWEKKVVYDVSVDSTSKTFKDDASLTAYNAENTATNSFASAMATSHAGITVSASAISSAAIGVTTASALTTATPMIKTDAASDLTANGYEIVSVEVTSPSTPLGYTATGGDKTMGVTITVRKIGGHGITKTYSATVTVADDLTS